ncbi:hypothetical protein RKE30_16625 [Streptomyces sp. Li-HN-5-11]|uniref:hypothetical protein n=1 Tax=Streptomyces sp. Li-HN-5-11 TaxID=3075432 RepID=UPI0028AC9954|nr:hypothetical protein [Streptomyces sp. Li-HN-5-11]WNM31919.1 hypothetical protein RKE30_16625 [Streptomyces sp. Li-HN-5-11]
MASPAPTPRPGDQLASATSSTRVIVIRAPQDLTGPIECGGSPMVPAAQAPAPAPSGETPGNLIGKRYVDAADTLELLCTASGTGQLTYSGEPLLIKAPKALPASD